SRHDDLAASLVRLRWTFSSTYSTHDSGIRWCLKPPPKSNLASSMSAPSTWSTLPTWPPSEPTTSMCSWIWVGLIMGLSCLKSGVLPEPPAPRRGCTARRIGDRHAESFLRTTQPLDAPALAPGGARGAV